MHKIVVIKPVSYTHLDVYKRQVLVENKPGSLMEVTSRLTEAHVNLSLIHIYQ